MTPSLETELERLGKNDPDGKTFWERYQCVRNYLSKDYYRWIQAECPYYTDHGEGHIQSVIQAASLVLSKSLEAGRRSDISPLDLYLLLSAILWHDVGNVLGRTDHADRIAEMTDEVKRLAFPDIAIQRMVVEIAKAHSGKSGLNIPRSEEDWSTYTIYPKALAAIVRFADEVSESRSRISSSLLPKVPEEHKIFWEYANCISASRVDGARERIVVTVDVDIDKAIERYACDEFNGRSDADGKISLIEYVICRLEKMNNERAYCAPEFRRYQTIREITVRLTLSRNLQRIQGQELELAFTDAGLSKPSYPEIPVYDDFFKTNPNWKPEALKTRMS